MVKKLHLFKNLKKGEKRKDEYARKIIYFQKNFIGDVFIKYIMMIKYEYSISEHENGSQNKKIHAKIHSLHTTSE